MVELKFCLWDIFKGDRTHRKLCEIRKTMHEKQVVQQRNRRDKTEILELKYMMTE